MSSPTNGVGTGDFDAFVDRLETAVKAAAIAALDTREATDQVIDLITEHLRGARLDLLVGDEDALAAVAESLAKLYVSDVIDEMEDLVKQLSLGNDVPETEKEPS
jgi:hypothetical protein